MDLLLTTGQVARLLGLQAYQIAYAHATGRVAEPPLRVMNKRLYTSEDVRRVAAHFGRTVGDEPSAPNGVKEGE